MWNTFLQGARANKKKLALGLLLAFVLIFSPLMFVSTPGDGMIFFMGAAFWLLLVALAAFLGIMVYELVIAWKSR